MNRDEHLRQMADNSFDLVVVGGGITGACLAFDASARGLRTALVERKDFGSATSAASSKLLHGGIRFLQQFRFDKVRESAFERVYFQNLVPHLCSYVPFVIPTYSGLQKGKAFLGAGALAYQLLSAGQNSRLIHDGKKVPAPRIVGRSELTQMIPLISDRSSITGGLVLQECHMRSSERVTLALIEAAVSKGCVVANYTSATNVGQHNGRIASVKVSPDSGEPFEIQTRSIANCAGPWLTKIDEKATMNTQETITSYCRGAHLVLKDLDLGSALALPTTQKIQGMADRGGRHIFLIPWRGHTLLGTSYAEHTADIDHVHATANDREQLLDAVNDALGGTVVTADNVVYSYAGLYPLTSSKVQTNVYQGASDYIVTDYGDKGGPRGYFSLFGAKYTTARKLAEVACNKIARQLPKTTGACITRRTTVPAADLPDPRRFQNELATRFETLVTADTTNHLFRNYGCNAAAVLDLAASQPDLARPIAKGRSNIRAEAIYCARNEMVSRLDDFVFRRTGLGTIGNPGHDSLADCVGLIGRELAWDEKRRQKELETVLRTFRTACH